ncbi:MAG: ribonuclease HI [Thermoplasmata archaeon]
MLELLERKEEQAGSGVAIVHFDGLNEPINPGGVACWGYVIEYGSTVIRNHGVFGAGMLGHKTTNNMAEYTGLIKSLEYLLALGFKGNLKVFGDSQIVINQMNGVYSVNSELLLPLYEKASLLVGQFFRVSFTWVPREQNAEADEQTNIAYREFFKEHEADFLKYYKKYLWSEKQHQFLGL